jgi:hypothetical protein
MQSEAEFPGVLVRSNNRRVLRHAPGLLAEYLQRTGQACDAGRQEFIRLLLQEVGHLEGGRKVIESLRQPA